MASTSPNLLFVVNPVSGKSNINWEQEIRNFMQSRDITYQILELPKVCHPELIKEELLKKKPDKLIAVGGDGTVKLAAEALINTNIPLGIIPAGSANGMAREFGIAPDFPLAMETVLNGQLKKIHLTRINDEYCIHLSDIGFNAIVVKKFEDENLRGMWGYVKAAWKVLWRYPRMKVRLKMEDESAYIDAAMVVVANATMYGNGVVINPGGSLYDELFEVVIIKKISIREIFKMRFTRKNFDENKTVVYQTSWLHIDSKHRVHFQVDGEYRGKVKSISAEIIPGALRIIIPVQTDVKS